MNVGLGRCLAMSLGAFLVAATLLLTGLPAVVLLAIVPAVACMVLHIAMVHGDPNGDELLAAARRARQTRRETGRGRLRPDPRHEAPMRLTDS